MRLLSARQLVATALVSVLLAGALVACPGPAPSTCGPSNCNGCCTPGGTCMDGLVPNACGRGGIVCIDCGANACVSGTCAPPSDGGAGGGGGTGGGGGGGGSGGCDAGPGDYTETLVHGFTRTYHVHIPPSYDCRRPTPLVFNFHGYTSNAAQQAAYSRMIAKSDDAGFIAVHAEGTGTLQSWNAGSCCGAAQQANVDDVGFVRAMADRIAERWNVDPRRIYATGMSNGGMLSHRLACQAADRIAAVAPVAGVNVFAPCNPSRPVPVLHFHGTADQTVPYNGGGSGGFGSVEQTISAWAQRDGCGTSRRVVYQRGDSTCETYDGCPAKVAVTLCTVDGGGHTWPGGVPVPALGRTTTDLSATDMMWDFFVAHPKP